MFALVLLRHFPVLQIQLSSDALSTDWSNCYTWQPCRLIRIGFPARFFVYFSTVMKLHFLSNWDVSHIHSLKPQRWSVVFHALFAYDLIGYIQLPVLDLNYLGPFEAAAEVFSESTGLAKSLFLYIVIGWAQNKLFQLTLSTQPFKIK